MDFQLPEYLEEDTAPQTETDMLLARVEEIESILLEGNTWRYVNGGSAAIGALVGLLGSATLSPLSILLLFSGSALGVFSYSSYVLWEGKELGIKPSPKPVSSGQKESIQDLLPRQQKAHYRLVQWYGQDAVNWIESQGCLDEVIRHAIAIKGTTAEEASAYAEKLKGAIEAHYLAHYPGKSILPPAQPRKAIAPTPSRQLTAPSNTFSAAVTTSRLDQGLPIYDEHGVAHVPSKSGNGFVSQSQLDDDVWNTPATSPLESPEDEDEGWEIPLSRKKQERAVPIKDIAQDIANFQKGNESHWCFVSPPRVGKSTLLLSAIAKMTGAIYLVDCKGDDTRLRNSKKLNPEVKYININTGEKIDRLFELLDYLEGELIHRQGGGDKFPITLIVDELNQLNITMQSHEMKTGKRNLFRLFSSILLRLVGQGLSSQIKVVFSTHSLRVEDLFGNGSTLHQVSVVGLGKKDKIASLKDVIMYKVDDDDKPRIRADMIAATTQSPQEVIAILVYGVPQVISLPFVDYSHLETVETTPTKSTPIAPPDFDDDEPIVATTAQAIASTPAPAVPESAIFTPNDLLTWLEKREGKFFKPREISANLKISVLQITEAANGLIQSEAEGIEAKNWTETNGKAIGFFKVQPSTQVYRDNLVPFVSMGV